MTDLPPPIVPNPPPSFSLDDIFARLSPTGQLEVRVALLSIELEQAQARIAELEAQ